jgi:nitrite reductase (NADH) large subunit
MGELMRILIIGNGVAGMTAAETIRAADKSCAITILSDEPYAFYSRPRLIEFLADTATVDQITIHARNWYEKNAIELLDSVIIIGVDSAAKTIKANNGKIYQYDKLVIASGATSFLPPVPGADLAKVFTLRTIQDAEKIKTVAREKKNAVVIGGGLLGIEVANSLSVLGVKVLVVELLDRLLPRQLDHDGSAMVRRLLERKGLLFCTGKQTGAVEKSNDQRLIRLNDGSEITTDFIVFSAGVRSDFRCVNNTPVIHNKGIIVDEFMRTNVPAIYACGDVAEYNSVTSGLWQPAREQGMTCGNHIVGIERPYKNSVPSTRLKVAGIDFASIGEIEIKEGVDATVEKDENAGVYKKLFTRDNVPVGAILIGNVKDAVKLQQVIKNGKGL